MALSRPKIQRQLETVLAWKKGILQKLVHQLSFNGVEIGIDVIMDVAEETVMGKISASRASEIKRHEDAIERTFQNSATGPPVLILNGLPVPPEMVDGTGATLSRIVDVVWNRALADTARERGRDQAPKFRRNQPSYDQVAYQEAVLLGEMLLSREGITPDNVRVTVR